jgi:two-component system copper resistance phosphate regulon response regulator CusR
MKILIIEDDEFLRVTLKQALESDVFTVDQMPDGVNGSYMARTNKYNLIIIDYILPGKDGLTIVKEIREARIECPILIMSVKGEVNDKVTLLEGGADDYLAKPFTYPEFRARVHALTKRNYKISEEILMIDDLTIDTRRIEITKSGQPVYLTRKEFGILQTLSRKRGQVVSRQEIVEEVWDMNSDPFSNTVEAHMRNLRKKIESPHRQIIQTIPGRGYKMSE